MSPLRLLIGLTLILVAPQGLFAQDVQLPETPIGQAMTHVLAAFGEDESVQLDAERFAPSFLAQVPAASLNQVPAAIRAQFGPLELTSIEKQDDSNMVVACRGATSGLHVRITMRLDDEGLIEGLLLRPASDLDRPDDSWDTVLEDLSALGDRTSLGVYQLKDGEIEVVHVINENEPLAVGSTFKLYVLGALAEMITDGEASWDETIAIRDELKSHPGGVMQNDEPGTEHTIQEFALKMISISDNTATDHLFDLVGRERIEDYLDRLNEHADKSKPFLSTREMFTIKLNEDQTIATRYAEASEDGRRAMLENEAIFGAGLPPLPDRVKGWLDVRHIDTIEWFISARDAARVMVDLHAKSKRGGLHALGDVLGANPGVAFDQSTWPGFFYKGGSEPGAINMTWLLERNDDRVFVVTMTVNNEKTVPEVLPMASIAARAIKLLADEE